MTVLCAADLAEGEKLLAEARDGDARQQLRAKDWLRSNADALLAAARQAETMREALEGIVTGAEAVAHATGLASARGIASIAKGTLAAVAAPNEAKQ